MTRICHFSDWHWGMSSLPEADLYVCTGDMLRNFPVANQPADRLRMDGTRGLRIDPAVERIKQKLSVDRFQKVPDQRGRRGFRQYLGSPGAPVLAVRGNHDFISLAPLFADCNLVHEFVDNEVVSILGMSVTGHRGIPAINGAWSDETPRPDLADRMRAMDRDCHVYLTHYPPSDVGMDLPGRWGMEELANWFFYSCNVKKPLHLFGHIHECGGLVHTIADVTFSNAAETYNLIEGSPETGWVKVG